MGTPNWRSPKLLALAEGRECLLRIPAICNGDPATTVAAHSNLLRHGKGRGLKAHDFFSVWACSHCHRWLDESQATRYAKEQAFMSAWEKQVEIWFRETLVRIS